MDDNERLCAMVEKNSPRAGLELWNARSVGQCLNQSATRDPKIAKP